MKKFLLSCLLSISVFSFSQVEEEEEKDYLVSFDLLEENDLYVSLEGYWKFDLSTAAEGDLSALLDNVIFKQTPDFTASIWLFNKFFFETQIKEKSEDNLFLFGYQNNEGILQEIRVGNSDINIDEYADYKPPENKQKAPGTRVKVATDNTTHELLARYTSEVKNSAKFRGYNQLEEESKTLNKYSNGNFFVLPFSSIDNITVYYKRDNVITLLDNQQYVYYKDKSLLYISNPEISQIYTGINGIDKNDLYSFIDPDNNPNTNLSGKTSDDLWNDYVINNSGQDLILIKNRGDFSPFEHLGVFTIDNQTTIIPANVQVYINGTKRQDYIIIDGNIVFWDITLQSAELLQRYPFKDLDSDIYTAEGRGLSSESIIKYSILTPVSDIRISTDAKEGSLSVSINGIQDFSYDHNSDTGIITFDRDISPFDEIVVNYDTEMIPGTGNLLLSYGSKYQLRDNLSLELSQTGTWDFTTDDYSYVYNNNRGNFESRASLAYETDLISADLDTLVGISNPDTLGNYLLFQYNQGNITLPANQLSNDSTVSGTVPLISRETGDQLLTLAQIKTVAENPAGGLYFANHIDNNTGTKVVVMETGDLTGGENSKGSVKLNDLKNDYSWARELTLDIYNDSGEARNLELTFYNPGLGESESLTKTITLSSDSGYNSYKLDFTRVERSKLTYLTNVHFNLANCTATTLLIKNIKFTGDSLVTHNGSSDYTISKSSSDMVIYQSTSNNINISSRITPIDINKYNHLKFSINNSGIIQSGSNVVLKMRSNQSTTGELIIPAERISTGSNNIDVNLETDSVTINGVNYNDITWKSYSDQESSSINMTIETTASSGNITISNIVLSEPKLSFYNKSKIKVTIRPEISIKTTESFPIIDNVEFSNTNEVAVDTDTTYEGESELSMDFVGTSLWTKVGYSKAVDNFEYKITIPYKESPIMVSDSFSYNINSKRENTLKINTSIVKYDLSLSDFKGDNQGLRDSSMNIDLLPDYPFNMTSKNSIAQKRSDDIESISTEFKESYLNLILEDNLVIENKFESDNSFIFKGSNWNINLNLMGNFDQQGLTKDLLNTKYKADLSTTLIFGTISITPGVDTLYKSTISEGDESSLSQGFNNFSRTFAETNPYKDINLSDMFINSNYSSFYKYSNSTNKRYLDSNLKINLSYQKQYNSLIAVLIPNSVTYSRGKEFSRNESSMKTLLNNSVKGDFLLHPDIKNSVNFKHSYNLEMESYEQTIEWLLTAYKQFSNKNVVDISNNLNINPDNITNLTKVDFIWPGKSGSVFILPAFDKILDSPYSYTHTERFYLKIENQKSYDIGLRHETVLKVKDINETTFYIDIGYNNSSTPLYFAAGLTLTLIF